jgi:hypothetical protein
VRRLTGYDPNEEQRRHEAATQTAMSAESSLANERCHHKAAAQAVESAELVLAKKRRRHKTTAREKVLADDACERRCQEPAECTAALAKSALAAERTAVLADLALPEPALAEDKQRQEETAKKQRRSDDAHVMAPVLPPNPVNAAIRRIRVECAHLAAPLDAILAKIERDDIANKAQAPSMTTSPHPVAMLSTPAPYDLRGRGPFYDGREHSCDIPCSGTVGYTIAYRQRPTPDGTPTRPTSLSHWLPPPSSRAQSS